MITWECVVKPDQVFREERSGVLFEVMGVGRRRTDCDADVRVRPVDGTAEEEKRVAASTMCGPEFERLCDDEGETCFPLLNALRLALLGSPVIWGGGTKVGPVGAR